VAFEGDNLYKAEKAFSVSRESLGGQAIHDAITGQQRILHDLCLFKHIYKVLLKTAIIKKKSYMNLLCYIRVITISLMFVSCKNGEKETSVIQEKREDVIQSAFCDNIVPYIIPATFFSGKICLSLTLINEKDSAYNSNVYFEVDSGTKELIIDSALVSSLNLPIKFGKKIRILAPDNIHNGYEGDIIKDKPLKIVLLSDTIFIEKCYISNGINILPMRILPENKIININVRDEYVALLDTIQYEHNVIDYYIQSLSGIPTIETVVNIEKDNIRATVSGMFGLDIGFSSGLLLRSNFMGKHTEFRYDTAYLATPFGGNKVYFQDIFIDDAVIEHLGYKSKLPVVFSRRLFNDGAFGLDFFNDYDIAFDTKNNKFHYCRLYTDTTKTKVTVYERWGIGFAFGYDNSDITQIKSLHVALTTKNRSGYLKNIRPNDKVIEIDNAPVDYLLGGDYVLSLIKNAETFTIQKDNGEIIYLR